MGIYREAAIESWKKLAKTIFTNCIQVIQPLNICIEAGNGWEAITCEKKINFELNEFEIGNANIIKDNLIIFVNFGKGYVSYSIPFQCIDYIEIGTEIIRRPVFNIPNNLTPDEVRNLFLKGEEDNDIVATID